MPRSFLRLPQVERVTGLKKSALYHLMRRGRFPKPVRLAPKAVAWPSDEIEAWQQAMIDTRDAAA